MRLNFSTCVVLVVLSASGCSQGESDDHKTMPPHGPEKFPSTGVTYRSIHSSTAAILVPFDLCTIVRHPMRQGAGSGLYVVKALRGETEDDLRSPGDRGGFTYVALSLVTGWYKAEENTVARILGGPFPSGQIGGWTIDLAVGDTVGLLFTAPTPGNAGYPDLDEHGTFKKAKNGGYTNGMLYTKRVVSADELGASVKALAGATLDAPCPSPYDERPDSVPTGTSNSEPVDPADAGSAQK